MPAQDPKKAQEKIEDAKKEPNQNPSTESRPLPPRNVRGVLDRVLDQHFNNRR